MRPTMSAYPSNHLAMLAPSPNLTCGTDPCGLRLHPFANTARRDPRCATTVTGGRETIHRSRLDRQM
jgi:hypothetical protein